MATKVKNPIQKVTNQFERLNLDAGLGSTLNKTVKDDVIKGAAHDALSQLDVASWLGLPGSSSKTEGKSPEKKTTTGIGIEIIFDVANHKKGKEAGRKGAEKPEARREAAINYHGEIARSSERASRRNLSETEQRIQQIMVEMQKLINSTQMLKREFATTSVEQRPVSPGKYHESFFEWMLIVIKQARQKVEDSGAWMKQLQSKRKGKKTTYDVTNGQMHQSGERTTIMNSAG